MFRIIVEVFLNMQLGNFPYFAVASVMLWSFCRSNPASCGQMRDGIVDDGRKKD